MAPGQAASVRNATRPVDAAETNNQQLFTQQFVDRLADVGAGHQRFADEHGLDAGLRAIDVGPAADAALADHHAIVRNLPQPQRVFQIGLERAQVAVVDADQRGAGVATRAAGSPARTVPPAASCPDRNGLVVQRPQVAVVEAFGDQQHGVGAGRAGFEHLVAGR